MKTAEYMLLTVVVLVIAYLTVTLLVDMTASSLNETVVLIVEASR